VNEHDSGDPAEQENEKRTPAQDGCEKMGDIRINLARLLFGLNLNAAEDREHRRALDVARLAIELAKKKSGRGGGIVPDAQAAASLLSAAKEALRREKERPNREQVESVDQRLDEFFKSLNPPVTFRTIKRGAKLESQNLSLNDLCVDLAPADHWISVECDGQKLGTWEVMRNKRAFRQFVRSAMAIYWTKRNPLPEGKTFDLTDSDVEEVLRVGLLSAEFFRALHEARYGAKKSMDTDSTAESGKVPEG